MTREQLEHAIRAVCNLPVDDEIWIFGSQSILGRFPKAPATLRASMELDVAPKNRPEHTEAINANLGEDSMFHETHGFYVEGVRLETAVLADGWQSRCVTVHNQNTGNGTGYCIDGHDLALAKLAANRAKDREFVRTLLQEELVCRAKLQELLPGLPVGELERTRIGSWIDRSCKELGLEDSKQ